MTVQGQVSKYNTHLFLDMSFLSGLVTIISEHNLVSGMFLGVVIAVLTLFLGRFFCGWICPMGSVHHFGSYVFREHEKKKRYAKNELGKYHLIKYIILTAVLFGAVFGVVLLGFFDPIALLTRFGVTVVVPLVNLIKESGKTQTVAFDGVAMTAMIVFGSFLMSYVQPRFWCRSICPLGAALSLFSIKPLFRMIRNNDECIHCGLCREHCQGACDIDKNLSASQCLMCMNCVDVCPTRAISFSTGLGTAVSSNEGSGKLNFSRRTFMGSLLAAFGSVSILRNMKNIQGRGFDKRIRPPGSLVEQDFLARCIRCGACMKVCPTNIIQPAVFETDTEGLWTPVLKMNYGACEYDCNLCSQVCPTGAIRRITIQEKHEKGFAKIGTAMVDRNRCLPWSYGKSCLVCQEVCPVSPKAIFHHHQTFTENDGTKQELNVPVVDPKQCIGCGACEFNCPVQDLPAIRVTSIGEFRDPNRKLLLND
jgi:MauM/NapG family ferredoxin protein